MHICGLQGGLRHLAADGVPAVGAPVLAGLDGQHDLAAIRTYSRFSSSSIIAHV